MRREQRDSRVWGWVLGHVHAPPARRARSAGIAVLAMLAIPALGMHTKVPAWTTLPRDPSRC